MLALAVAFFGFSLAPSLALACLASFLGGMGNGVGQDQGTMQPGTPNNGNMNSGGTPATNGTQQGY